MASNDSSEPQDDQLAGSVDVPDESAELTDADQPAVPESKKAESDWQRRKRLAEVFGDVLPASTSDDRDPEDSRQSSAKASDDWLRRQVPPHHGN